MNTKSMAILVALTALVFAATAAFAGGASYRQEMGKGKTGLVFDHSQRLSEFIGSNVTNSRGDRLGHVNDLIADEDGRISYLVLAKGGSPELVAIPFAAISPKIGTDGTVMIDVDKRTLDAAPSFSAANYPDFSDNRWNNQVRGYFGAGPVERSERAPARQETEHGWMNGWMTEDHPRYY